MCKFTKKKNGTAKKSMQNCCSCCTVAISNTFHWSHLLFEWISFSYYCHYIYRMLDTKVYINPQTGKFKRETYRSVLVTQKSTNRSVNLIRDQFFFLVFVKRFTDFSREDINGNWTERYETLAENVGLNNTQWINEMKYAHLPNIEDFLIYTFVRVHSYILCTHQAMLLLFYFIVFASIFRTLNASVYKVYIEHY